MRIENRLEEAEKVLLIAKNIDSSNSDLMYNFSLLYSSTKKYDLSLNYINKAIDLSNNIDIYKILKADVLIRSGQLDKALLILKILKYSIINTKQLQINILISEIYMINKNFSEAEKVLLQTVKNYSNSKIGYLNLSQLYLITKE